MGERVVTDHEIISGKAHWATGMEAEGHNCHNFHPFCSFLSKFEAPKHSFKPRHGVILSYLILSFLFTLQSHTKKNWESR